MNKAQILDRLHATVAHLAPGGGGAVIEDYLKNIMRAESRGSITAKNPKSSACGLWQFIDSTWEQYEGGKSKFDVDAQCDAAVRFALDNGAALTKKLGHTPTAADYYLAHFLGAGDGDYKTKGAGALTILSADPHMRIKDVLSDQVMDRNSGIKMPGNGKKFADFTVADLRQWAAARMNVHLDAREAYARRRAAGLTNRDEDAEEARLEGNILVDFGVPPKAIELLGTGILGIFMALIRFFMDASAPEAERAATPVAEPPELKTLRMAEAAASLMDAATAATAAAPATTTAVTHDASFSKGTTPPPSVTPRGMSAAPAIAATAR